MKLFLHSSFLVASLFLYSVSHAQVTLIADNSDFTSGLVLPNGKPVMINENGQMYTTDGSSVSLITTAVTHPNTESAMMFNNKLYFSGVNTANDTELWVTDGTTAGTVLVQNIAATGSSEPASFFVFNNSLYFTADDGVNGRELWRTNGSANNATLVSDIDGTAAGSITDDATFFQNGNTVFFTATAAGKPGLYKLTASGISLVKESFADEILLESSFYCAAIGSKTVFTAHQGTDFFTGKTELWVTDGTTAGTVMLNDFGFGSFGMLPSLILYKNFLYFDGFDLAGSGIELWRTDGTKANTKLFKDIDPGPGASSSPFLSMAVIFNNILFFSAYTTAEGLELWSTDGTTANTKLFKDINPGEESSDPFFLVDASAFANMWQSGNNFIFQNFYTVYNGKLYFAATDGTHGMELWSTDGTAANTTMVTDINTAAGGDALLQTNLSFYTSSGIYFNADDGISGNEPWVTDGTAGGTTRVADVNPGAGSSDPEYSFLFNNQLYFNANNGGQATDLYKFNKQLSTLPVQMLSFTASLQSGTVWLNWATAHETNTSRFVIQRSTDAVHFTDAGRVAATGNSHAVQNYRFADAAAPKQGTNVLYYRLQTIDKDGRYSYSGILTVQLTNGLFTVSLSPNPAHHLLTVSMATANSQRITLRISDVNGKQVYLRSYSTAGMAAMQQNIDVSSFASGTYIIQFITGKDSQSLKFIKQ